MQAKGKRNIKRTVDVCMTLVLLSLMAYQVCGELLHEWGGILMSVLLIFHHILNRKWYTALFRGRYNAYRAVTTAVNTLLMGCFVLTALCGMSMSAHAVPFMYGILPVSFARQVHLALSYWSFVLMGIHLGLHIPAMTSGLRSKKTLRTVFYVIFTIIAGVGFCLFVQNRLPDYMFLRTPFAFLDYEKAAVLVFAENIAILTAFALTGTCLANVCRAAGDKINKGGILRFVIPVAAAVIIAALLIRFNADSVGSEPSGNEEQETPQQTVMTVVNDGYILIPEGTFLMGSPETENWRIDDETQHEVTVSGFYIDPYETTQAEYERLMGKDPST
ncbi:MAG: SUMF1/EgtB/PvdO family nonheme iron enzyme, partial [Eubacteriales bacterium]|nr:SUMF1/EgtB/PvdO family nonheme iron enzyme [Eubacteriales bacterium]